MKDIAGTIREAIDSGVERKIAPYSAVWEECFTSESLSNIIEESVDGAVDTVVWEAVNIARDWD